MLTHTPGPHLVELRHVSPGVVRVSVKECYDSGDVDADDDLLIALHRTNAQMVADRNNRRARYAKGYPPERGP
jgi:hypothetical protein